MKQTVKLGSRTISPHGMPYVIAEIGVNHGGSLDLAKHLIDLAKAGGADAAKFQSYKADTLASKNSPSYWDTTKESTRSQHDLFKKYDNFGPEEYKILAQHCKSVEIDFLSTPFDDAAIEFLDELTPFFKIASADITNIPFLRKVAKKGKVVILSTGASTLSEIDLALDTLNSNGCREIILLHCILNYPTKNFDANLRMIQGLMRTYPDYYIGYSDHTMPDEVMSSLVIAHLLGATVIEKHFTYDKSLTGNDHYHAMDVNDLKKFIEMVRKTHDLLGNKDHKQPLPSEEISRKNARRSIVLQSNLLKGHILTEKDLTYKRPGTGISPIHWDQVVGMRLVESLKEDHILSWRDIEPAVNK
jgi:sialic acid synthase SpsE